MEVTKNNAPANRKSRRGLKLTLAVGAMLAGLLAPITALGDDVPSTQPADHTMPTGASDSTSNFITTGLDANGGILLEKDLPRKIGSTRKIKRVNVLGADIADVLPLSATEVLVTPKKPGTTQLVIWDEKDNTQIIQLTVQSDIVKLIKQLKTVFPNNKIEATEINGSIALRGHMKTLAEADQATQIAMPYSAAGKILNFMDVAGAQQIMLQVRFAEVSKTAAANLGINFGFTDGTSFFGNNVGNINPFGTAAAANGLQTLTSASPGAGIALFGQGLLAKEAFQYFISAAQSNNVLRMLAEPDLVTTSGVEADFLAGGQFPIPISQGSNSGITVEYKEFGIKLQFLPVVLGDGHISIKVSPESSDLDFSTAVQLSGFVIPGLTTRRVNTTVDLVEGQTFAIAGLLSSDYSANVTGFPGLMEIPVLGALFRSVNYQRKETELVVMVTPVLVHPMDPVEAKPTPGHLWRYPNEADLFFFKDMGGEKPDTAHAPGQDLGPAPKFHGAYGFRPPEAPATK